MVLRFYKGGPQALAGTFFWWTRAPHRASGCAVARSVDVRIPDSTYHIGPFAEAPWSATRHLGGGACTAILPLEF